MDHLEALLSFCTWPSEALWRSFELGILRDVPFQRPILELGCGDVTCLALVGPVHSRLAAMRPEAV